MSQAGSPARRLLHPLHDNEPSRSEKDDVTERHLASETLPHGPRRVGGGHRRIGTPRGLHVGAHVRTVSSGRTPTSAADAKVAAGIDREMALHTPYDRIRAILVQANGRTVFERYYRSTAAEKVIVLADGGGVRRPATVNRHLAGVIGFYDHHARSGIPVACELVAWRRARRASFKPFLHT